MTNPISARLRSSLFKSPITAEAADHIDAQDAKIKALEDALERIASRHVTKSPLWWQVEARTALAAAKQPTVARPVTVAEAAKVLLDAGIERDLAKSMAHFISVKEWEGYKRGVKAYTSTLRALSHEGGE